MQYKKLIYIYLYIILASSIFITIGFYVYDPLQLFHKPWGREVTFSKNMRQQAAGITNNYKFDSIIIGSSIIENTSAKEANNKVGGNFINISLSGSSYYERLIVMDHVFRKHSIKKVIYSLDAGSYIHQQKGYPSYPLELFDYLYDKKEFNDFKAYFNYDFLGCLLTFSKSEQCIGHKTSLDRPNAWFDEEGNKARYGGLHKWLEANNSNAIKSVFKNIISETKKIKSDDVISLENIEIKIFKAKHYVDETIIDFVKKNPKTEFLMLFPPYSRINYALWAQYNLPYFRIHKAIIQYFVEKSEELPNFKIYAFEDQSFLDNIANYKDPIHYHHSIDSWMLSKIEKDSGRLKQENLNEYLQSITNKALMYNVVNIGKKIDDYLKNN